MYICNNKKYHVFAICLQMVFFCIISNCTGLKVNHYTEQTVSKPIDGNILKKGEFLKKPRYYPSGNLDYMQDITKRDNSLFFSSAKEYNNSQYNIAVKYLNDYNVLLKTNAELLEENVKSGNFDISSDEMTKKMELGEARNYPLKDNILIMQKLYSEDEKIARPPYMKEYIDIYSSSNEAKDNEQNQDEPVAIDGTEQVELSKKLSNEDKRNQYVEHYLAMSE